MAADRPSSWVVAVEPTVQSPYAWLPVAVDLGTAVQEVHGRPDSACDILLVCRTSEGLQLARAVRNVLGDLPVGVLRVDLPVTVWLHALTVARGAGGTQAETEAHVAAVATATRTWLIGKGRGLRSYGRPQPKGWWENFVPLPRWHAVDLRTGYAERERVKRLDLPFVGAQYLFASAKGQGAMLAKRLRVGPVVRSGESDWPSGTWLEVSLLETMPPVADADGGETCEFCSRRILRRCSFCVPEMAAAA